MKEKRQRTEKRIEMLIVLGCVVLLAGVCVFAGSYLHRKDQAAYENAEAAEEAAVSEKLTMEVEAVKAQENMLGSSFENKPDDPRKPLRIVEVIPHDACSVFPYMVDWKTVEGYDENTFLGYEALRTFTTSANLGGSRAQFTLFKEGETRETLKDYNVTFIQEDNWGNQTGWWRATKADQKDNIYNVNGYFEYVGNNNGLYELNLEQIVKEDSKELGIRYDIMAMERKGSESKKGEWEVKDAQYYWAKDYDGKAAYLKVSDGKEIKQRSDYNYDLKFQTGGSSTGSTYRVKEVITRTEAVAGMSSTNAEDFEYAAYLADTVTDWDGGYIYSEQGNYGISKANAVIVNDTNLSDIGNYYIRVRNDSKADGSSGLEPGYFQRCTTSDNITTGSTVYDLTFVKTVGGKYILSPAAVQSKISLDGSAALDQILFEYTEKGKGNYNIAFIYSPATESAAGALYTCSLLKVSDGDGRYALTSTEPDKENLYEAVGNGNGDYSKAVTHIDCAGIDYMSCLVQGSWTADTQQGYYLDNVTLPGLTMGVTQYGTERGNWVFHTVDSDEANGFTKIEELEKDPVPYQTRIYVYGQNRKNRYYARSGFENNEWFKLLFYLSTPDGSQPLAYQDYADNQLTPTEIKNKYKTEIEGFDRSYRIEIIQKTPGELTKDDVEKADLLYFGTTIGLPGMTTNIWNSMIDEYGLDLDKCYDPEMDYTDDLSTEVLFAIYKNCLYDCTTSLMFSARDFGSYVKDEREVTTNLGKMGFLANLFNDPSAFAYFLEGYDEKKEEYTTIHTNADVTIYKQTVQGIGELYNMGSTHLQGDFNSIHAGDPIEPYQTNTWQKDYFRVVELEQDENGNYKLQSQYDKGDGKYGYNWGTHGWANFAGMEVDDDNRTWYVPYLTTDSFSSFSFTRNIWKILHNKKSKVTSEPVVIVTNADGDNITDTLNITPTYYFYVDAFALGGGNEDFEIDYQVNWTPEEVDEPTPLSSVTVARSDGSVVQSISGPAYKSKYSCNVANDFKDAEGAFDESMNSKEYRIKAVDAAGKEDEVIVRFIVRDSFMLN